MKPGDFLLGVLDFFAILLPGGMATWLVTRYIPPEDLDRHLSFGPDGPGTLAMGAAFLLASYMLGHFVFMIGSKLDPLYDRWRRRAKPESADQTFRQAEDLRELSLEPGQFSTLKWAKAYIQIHAPGSRVEIDRLEADSKFFRSLVVVAIVFSLHFLLTERTPSWTIAFVVLGALAFQRYVDQRWKMTELSYATAVILHRTKVEARTVETGTEASDRKPSS